MSTTTFREPLPAGTGAAVDFLQKKLEEQVQEATNKSLHLAATANRRLWVARVLKGIAVFGGIAIAAGLPDPWAQGVGILIAVAIAYDGLSSNHKRLLSDSSAEGAYARLATAVIRRHDEQLPRVVSLNAKDPKKAAEELEKLLTSLQKDMNRGLQAIEDAVREARAKALQALDVSTTKDET